MMASTQAACMLQNSVALSGIHRRCSHNSGVPRSCPTRTRTLAWTFQAGKPSRSRLQIRMAQNDPSEKPSSGEESSTESMFLRELKRRGISSDKDGKAQGPSVPLPAPPAIEQMDQGQLERSRKLNSEGLEGLIPRATELVKLGGSFFLAFGPLIAGAAVVFVSAYLIFGSGFVHGGRTSMPPKVVDPYALLDEEDRLYGGRVPFQSQPSPPPGSYSQPRQPTSDLGDLESGSYYR
eukprot:jgi/Mesvir1/1854/Mv06953-RA.1